MRGAGVLGCFQLPEAGYLQLPKAFAEATSRKRPVRLGNPASVPSPASSAAFVLILAYF